MYFEKVPDYFYTQSGVIPYKVVKGELKVLLVTSSSGKNWIIPKGVVEPGMTPQESAKQEAYEEAGINGDVAEAAVGFFKVLKWDGVCTVTVYPMLVKKEYDEWLESSSRKRRWMTADTAVDKIKKNGMKQVLVDFVESFKK